MEFTIKNIILYDIFGGVVGFAEFKIRQDRTDIKVRHNLPVRSNEINREQLVFSIVANGEEVKTFAINGVQSLFEVRHRIDAENEIFIRISKLGNGEAETLASGVINQTKITSWKSGKSLQGDKDAGSDAESNVSFVCADKAENAVVKTQAVRELDDALRSICIIDENGKGQCETCPYRDHFFGTTSGEDDIVL